MKSIVAIGDSHASLYSNLPERHRGVWNDSYLGDIFEPKWLGPYTFWRLCREQKSFIDFDQSKEYEVCGVKFNTKAEPGQEILIIFGEIDVRCHILKFGYSKYKETVDNMVALIEKYIESYNGKFKFHIQSIVPPIYRANFRDKVPLVPFVGSDEERKSYVLYFNKCLKEKCKENNWIFFDVYNSYCDNNGYLSKKLSDGKVHIRNGIFIKKFIIDYLL